MKSHAAALFLGILIILVLGIFGILNVVSSREGVISHACTQEAKQCPDGSYVGRTGERCEFAECPKVPSVTEPGSRDSASTTSECNQDAKVCPDGSTVGRTGNDCHFAACPATNATSGTIKTTIGQRMTALNVTITPLEVTEDSRCPKDVQCIWAGTVKVKATLQSGLGESEVVFGLGTPITTEAEEIVLTEVTPSRNEGDVIQSSSYRFVFEISKR